MDETTATTKGAALGDALIDYYNGVLDLGYDVEEEIDGYDEAQREAYVKACLERVEHALRDAIAQADNDTEEDA